MDDVPDEAGASLSQSFGMDKADIFFGRTLKLTLGWKIRSHRSENGKKIMGENPQSLENHGFPQISQLVLHSMNFRKGGVLETSSATSVATILGNVSSIKTVVGDVWDVMTANPILCVFICVSLLSVGFAVFRKAKRAARG